MTTDRSLRAPVLIGWLLATFVLTLAYASDVAHLWFPDPDDAMRLNEVRDWIAGQSWWDVDQHRLWGGAFRMHWSRLVDLPLAGVIVMLRPLLGVTLAERAALLVIPLVTLLAIMATAAVLTRRLAGRETATLAVLLAPLSVPIVYQVRPMRIDHHGWQIALALAAVAALVGRARADAMSGVLAGAALAALLTISLEGLPITTAIVAVTLLAWALRPERRAQAGALLATLLAGAVVLHIATRGPGMWNAACDAISPAWIGALAVAVIGGLAILAAPLRTPVARIVALVAVGGAALATLLAAAPLCARGPFATLDPLVYQVWYRSVSEGLPVWEQVPAWGAMTIAFPLFGLTGTALAWRRAAPEARVRWAMLLAVAVAGLALSLLVMRTGATANALAIPGGAWLLERMLVRARAIQPIGRRTLATAAALLLASPGIVASALFALPVGGMRTPPEVASGGAGRAACHYGHEMAALRRLPRSTLFAPLDVTPALLAWTGHRAIGSGYHRNPAAIHRVLETFLASPDRARALVLASHADYVVGCPGENETELYKRLAPNGLWARLERGERLSWLVPVDTGSRALAWRVIRPLPAGIARP